MKQPRYLFLISLFAIALSLSLSGCLTMSHAAQGENYEADGDFRMAIWHYSFGFAYDNTPDANEFDTRLGRIKETVGAGDEYNQHIAYSINSLVEDMREKFVKGDLEGMKRVNYMEALEILSLQLPEELREEAMKGM